MICNLCGANLPEGARFCGSCGGAVNPDTPAVAVKKSRKALWISLVALLCAAALAVGAYFAFFYNVYNGLMEDIGVAQSGDFSNLEELAPPQAWDRLFQDTKVMVDSLESDPRYAAAPAQIYQSLLREVNETTGVGDNMEVDGDVVCDHPVTQAKQTEILVALESRYRISPATVEDFRLLHIEYRVTGSLGAASYMADYFYAVKIEGNWYLMWYDLVVYDTGERQNTFVFVAEALARDVIEMVLPPM